MLVLSRKVKERIVINGNIELVVVAVNGDRVQLGFNAPSNVAIHREELHRRVKTESLTGELATVAALTDAEMVLADLIRVGVG